MKCKNCSEEISGHYCSNCGQKLTLTRLNIKNLFYSFLSSFNLENGFLITLRLLLRNPKDLLDNYIHGKTKAYYNPIKFLVVLTTLQVLVTSYISGKGSEVELMNNPLWIVFSLFILVPALSIFSYLISRKKYNFTENLIINIYALGVINLISIFILLLRKLLMYMSATNWILTIFLIIFVPILYLAFVYSSIFNKNFVLMFIITFFSYLFSLFLFAFTFHLIGIINLDDFATT